MTPTPTLSLDQLVSVRGTWEGHVRFIGPTGFAEGEWAGIELLQAVGRNDGSVRGVRYFSCPPRHGLFVQVSQCTSIDRPSEDLVGGGNDDVPS